ncbi:eukaryotic initiation factor 4E, partial [Thraustotheca clavata]
MWEDPINAKGGKWILTNTRQRRARLDDSWMHIMLALIGEALDDEDDICGCVVSVRKSQDRLAVWTKTASNETLQRTVGRNFRKTLDLGKNEVLKFQSHADAAASGSSFQNEVYYVGPIKGLVTSRSATVGRYLILRSSLSLYLSMSDEEQKSVVAAEKPIENKATAQETSVVDAVVDEPAPIVAKHPLQHRWVLWYDNPKKKLPTETWEENLKKIYTFDTVEDFWCLFNNVLPPTKLSTGSNYHLFKEGIRPMWEDPINAKGGKWILTNTRQR